MTYFVFAGVLLALATVLDFVIRLRMTRAGHKWVFLLGGAFDYSEYSKACESHGWSLWPLRLFWVSAVLGILMLVIAVVLRFGL